MNAGLMNIDPAGAIRPGRSVPDLSLPCLFGDQRWCDDPHHPLSVLCAANLTDER